MEWYREIFDDPAASLAAREYFWSAENQLDSASFDGSSFVKYAYNAFGKPVIKYTRTSSTGWSVDSYFIWDGEQLLLDLDASGNRRAGYAYFPGTIGNPAAQTIGATSVTAIRDFQVDGIGTVIGTTAGTSASQTVHDKGPLPRGTYTFGRVDSHKGPYTIQLIPHGNEMFGRGSFLIHGDNGLGTASHGCIAIGPNARRTIARAGGGTLTVTR